MSVATVGGALASDTRAFRLFDFDLAVPVAALSNTRRCGRIWAMKQLATGNYDFARLINDGYVYVDKTERELLHGVEARFLEGRPYQFNSTSNQGTSKMKRVVLGIAVVAVAASALAQVAVPAIENTNQAYGVLSNRIEEIVRLWPGLAPHETEANPGRFAKDAKHGTWRRVDVSCPELVILRPEGKPRDAVVIVMPGGGYSAENMSCGANTKPILDSGRWLAILHYRIPRRKGRDIYAAPREDAARAIRFLRANAAKYGWSPEKIGAVGFSAGGHLAAISATSSQDALYERVDELDDLSAHLNFSIPVYPAYVLEDGKTGRNEQGGDGAAILPEFKFDAKTPPMFMVHGDKDYYSPMASVQLYTELHKRKIPAQLFVYANTSHGLGGDKVNVKGWQQRIVDWIESIGF